MTSLRERFMPDMKEAMKAGEKEKVAAIRLIVAALKEKDIEARGAGKGEATDDEILGVLPVSYTHLDVYKRQRLTSIHSGSATKLAQAFALVSASGQARI